MATSVHMVSDRLQVAKVIGRSVVVVSSDSNER